MTSSNVPSLTEKVTLVRLALGGDGGLGSIFTDTQIQVVLNAQPIVTYAAAALADAAAAHYASKPDVTLSRTKISNSQKAKAAKEIAKCLRESPGDLPGGDGTGVPDAVMIVGGISKDEKDNFLESDDRIQPSFSLGMDDNPTPGFNRERDDRRDDC